MEEKLTQQEKERIKILLLEIEDLFLAMEYEINRENAYRHYLKEKMQAINTDINCINSILNIKEEI